MKGKRAIWLMVLLFTLHTPLWSANPARTSLRPNYGRNPWYLEDFRFGVGVGYGLYITNQMDYQITRNFGALEELQPNFTLGVFKVMNEDLEFGIHYRKGHLMTLKSENTQGASCDFDEVQFQVNYSLNHDVGMTSGRYTINAQAGLGANHFRSMYFMVNPETKAIAEYVSSVGYENSIISRRDEAAKITTLIVNLGIVMGYRLSNNFMLYWENSLNTSITNKMSGNLFKRSWLPPDSYFYTGLALYINFKPARGKLSCPQF